MEPVRARLAAERWSARRTYAADALPGAPEVAARKVAEGLRVSVALPALNEEATIGPICETVRRELMERTPLVDELVVLDGRSTDGTARAAAAAGADVVDASALVPEVPAVPGKGDSMWRGLTRLGGDVVVWLDADVRNFAPHFVVRLVAPLVADPEIAFVKAFYRRPLEVDGRLVPEGGGRVTELLARPMLAELFPELSRVHQPLAGEYAGRRDLLGRLPFLTGYSVEVALLIDIAERAGLDAIAQVDLTERVHRNRPIEELAPMARAICRTLLERARRRGRLREEYRPPLTLIVGGEDGPREVERPPIDSLRPAFRPVAVPS